MPLTAQPVEMGGEHRAGHRAGQVKIGKGPITAQAEGTRGPGVGVS